MKVVQIQAVGQEVTAELRDDGTMRWISVQNTGEPPPLEWQFEIGAGLVGASSNSPQLVYTNIDKARGGFGTFADPARSGTVFPALDPVDRYPAEDFGMVLPEIPYSASAQTLHCRLLGTATITASTAAWSIANATVVGVAPNLNTEFDIVIGAGASENAKGILRFANTRRLSTDTVSTGCRGLYIRSPGIALDDPAQLMPYMAAALAPFAYIRYMNPLDAWTNIATRKPADRATPTRKPFWPGWPTPQTVSVEECVEISNQLGKSAWVCIPVAADDALIEEFATVVRDNLDPSLWCLFELSNEIWNLISPSFTWSVVQAMNEVNGFVWAYPIDTVCAYMTKTAGTVTAEFDEYGHGLQPGDVIYANSQNASLTNTLVTPNGYKTVLTTPSPTVCTWLDSPAGADSARVKVDGTIRSKRLIVSATRLGTVMTLVFGQDHNMVPGQLVRCGQITGLSTAKTAISTTPDARTITLPCAAGADGPIALFGGSSVVSNFASVLNSYDSAQDQFLLARRWYAKRTKEMSDIISRVFGAKFGTRAKVGLFNQPNDSQLDQMTFLSTVYGPVKNYIHVMGKGSYTQLNASGFPGGFNMRDVTTFDGSTPPTMQSYIDAWQLTAEHIKDATGPNTGNYDATAMVARLHELPIWSYEFGPDATATNGGDIAGAAGTAAGAQKINALHDPVFDAPYRTHLDTLETAYFQKVTVFNAGQCAPGNTSAFQSWGIFRDFTTPETSPRWKALSERKNAPRLGPTRNLLDGPTTIDGRAILGIYPPYSGAYPSVAAGNPPMQNWIVTVAEDGDWNFSPTFACSSGTKNIIVQVNGVSLAPNYVIPVGTNTQAARLIHLTRGHNVIRTIPGTASPGAAVTCISLLFEPA